MSPNHRSNRPRLSGTSRSEEHTSELQSQSNLVCRLLLEKKKKHKFRPRAFNICTSLSESQVWSCPYSHRPAYSVVALWKSELGSIHRFGGLTPTTSDDS